MFEEFWRKWRMAALALHLSIVHFFSSIAHVWVPGAKTTGPIVKKVWFFLNLIFMSVRILSFNAIHSVIKKMFHKSPVAANGACQKWHILFLDIFQRNLAHL
jgi:hypothetical protein